MAEGRVVAEGPATTVMDDQAVIDAYLGAHHDTDLGDDSLLTEETYEELAEEVADEEHAAPSATHDTTADAADAADDGKATR
jgi:neutral amino acid transport system ATP-binding protein